MPVPPSPAARSSSWTTSRRAGRTEPSARWRSTRRPGKILWTQEWPANYGGIQWPVGPRATPTVDGDRVYVLGADGKLFCLNVEHRRDHLEEGLRQGLQGRSPEVGLRLGLRQLADRRRRSADRPGRRPARRAGRGVQQDDRQGNLARAVGRWRARRRPADHHHRGRRPAAHHLVSRCGGVAGSGDRQDLLDAAVQGRRLDDGRDSDAAAARTCSSPPSTTAR